MQLNKFVNLKACFFYLMFMVYVIAFKYSARY